MLDQKLLRADIQTVADNLKKRAFSLNINKFLALENDRKKVQEETQSLQAEKNAQSKLIGRLKAQGDDITDILQSIASSTDKLKSCEEELKSIQKQVEQYLYLIPNLLHENVPYGKSEDDNKEIRTWGTPTVYAKEFDIKDHVDIGELLHQMDFKSAAKITGSRFVVLKSQIARMHRALIQLMMDSHTEEHNYTEMYVPYLVNNESLLGTGQLPKFSEDLFKVSGDHLNYSLIPTAEVPLTNLVRNEILNDEDLPLKFVAHTPCFRSEAGSYGRDTRGMIRQHQFEKVELVQIVKPEEGLERLEELTSHAENILKKLKLPYRVVELCSGDIGFSAKKTYDLEVWLPSQNTYREISSCSWFGDFQSRRMLARYKSNSMKKPELVHTLNGSGLAVGRTLVAILENYQQKDGSVIIPNALKPYMGNLEVIPL
jgi:seryl-tRNA synthetase